MVERFLLLMKTLSAARLMIRPGGGGAVRNVDRPGILLSSIKSTISNAASTRPPGVSISKKYTSLSVLGFLETTLEHFRQSTSTSPSKGITNTTGVEAVLRLARKWKRRSQYGE
jgi:hypothetical protein